MLGSDFALVWEEREILDVIGGLVDPVFEKDLIDEEHFDISDKFSKVFLSDAILVKVVP